MARFRSLLVKEASVCFSEGAGEGEMKWSFGRRSWGAREISGGYCWCSGRASTCIMEILHLSCFSFSILSFLPLCPSKFFLSLSFFPTAGSESVCSGLKRWGCNTRGSPVWSGAGVTLALGGRTEAAFSDLPLRRDGLNRALGGVSDCFVSPLACVSRQRRYVYVLYNRNRGEKGRGMTLLIISLISLFAVSFWDFLCFSA